MKQRFLNQKLGKRTSRKRELEKARLAAARSRGSPQMPPGKRPRSGAKLP